MKKKLRDGIVLSITGAVLYGAATVAARTLDLGSAGAAAVGIIGATGACVGVIGLFIVGLATVAIALRRPPQKPPSW